MRNSRAIEVAASWLSSARESAMFLLGRVANAPVNDGVAIAELRSGSLEVDLVRSCDLASLESCGMVEITRDHRVKLLPLGAFVFMSLVRCDRRGGAGH